MYRSSLKNLSTVYYKELSGCTMLASWRVPGRHAGRPMSAAGLEDARVGKAQDPVLAVHGSLSATMEEVIAHRWVASEECGYAVYSLMIAVGKHFILVD